MTEAPRTTANVKVNIARMRRRRHLQGLNQTQLAKTINVDKSYISIVESGKRRNVSPEVFARWCDALGVENREELIDDTDNEAA
jgi:transcriptional regulator with XRE-family HTH domain